MPTSTQIIHPHCPIPSPIPTNTGLPMNLEPESIQPSDSLAPSSGEPDEVEEALQLLELDPTTVGSIPSLEETAAAIDSELEAAVRQSETPKNETPQPSSPLDELYAQLLEDNPSPPDKDRLDEPDGWLLDNCAPSSPTVFSISAKPSGLLEERSTTDPKPILSVDFDWVEAPTDTDTIAALTDLLPKMAVDTLATTDEIALQTWESLQVNPDAPITEEGYLQASPDEDLLSAEDEAEDLEEDLQLAPSTMQQLESDLHRLEDLEGENSTQPEDLEVEDEAVEIGASDAELDAIFPTFVLGETADDTVTHAQVDRGSNTEEATPHPPEIEDVPPPEEWYLGLDFGMTGISAVLLHRPTAALYPMYWWKSEPSHPPERLFRLPATAYVSLEDDTATIVAVGFAALDLQVADAALGDEETLGILLQGFKSCLNSGLSWTDDLGHPQPRLQWSGGQALPLERVQTAVQTLLATIAQSASVYDVTSEDPTLADGAIHPPQSDVPLLAGIAVGVNNVHSEAYRFNLREAILQAGLVRGPEQVAFLEESIAAVLSALPRNVSAHSADGNWQFSPEWGGTALTIEAGATATELVLVDLPANLDELTHDRFHRQSFPYGGRAIDQDIICQLLLREDWLQAEFTALQAPVLPQPGEPDLEKRIAFGQWLQSSALGQFLLEAAAEVKVQLQEQERLTLEWGDRSIPVLRRDLESRVLVAYVQRLNRELNRLLSRTGVAVEGINQALCTGGSASWTAIARWLRQKLPNATIAQDVYPNGQSTSCSRVAYGLAALPLYPNLLGTMSPHYGDYFLLRELLDTFPNCALSVQELLPLLERRGINVRVCQPRILEFLNGRLPLGLVPGVPDAQWLTPESRQHPFYQQLTAMPLFEIVGEIPGEPLRERTYRPNLEQIALLHQYLSRVTANTAQTLEEPEILSLGVGHA
ncbi:MAG: hypothetical protein WBB29_18075 [Geitlerinemataceae cyanobacterium]